MSFYRIPNSKTTIIMDNFRRIAIETKKCKIFNAINLPETEKMDIDENDSQNIEQNDDDNLLTSEITKNEETSNETSITLRQYESPLQAMKSMSARLEICKSMLTNHSHNLFHFQ